VCNKIEIVPTLYLTIGAPGAGKTQFVSWSLIAVGKVTSSYLLNPDGLLFEGRRYEWSQQRAQRAWSQMRSDFQRLLQSGQSIALDATLAQKRTRQPFIKAAQQSGYRVVAIYFEVPLDVLVIRDAQRKDYGKQVGQNVIRRFVAKLEPPKLEEGIDEIRVVGPDGNIYRTLHASQSCT
jgi:predicted kinase